MDIVDIGVVVLTIVYALFFILGEKYDRERISRIAAKKCEEVGGSEAETRDSVSPAPREFC